MKDSYEFFKRSDEKSSEILAANLSVKSGMKQRIDGFFALLLSKRESFRTLDADLRPLPNASQTRKTLEDELRREYITLNFNKFASEARIYALAKVISHYNIIQTSFLKRSYVETIFALNLAVAFRELSGLQSLGVSQLAAVSSYVSAAPVVSHCGFALSYLFALENGTILKRCESPQRRHILSRRLQIHQIYDLYGDLKAFNKKSYPSQRAAKSRPNWPATRLKTLKAV